MLDKDKSSSTRGKKWEGNKMLKVSNNLPLKKER